MQAAALRAAQAEVPESCSVGQAAMPACPAALPLLRPAGGRGSGAPPRRAQRGQSHQAAGGWACGWPGAKGGWLVAPLPPFCPIFRQCYESWFLASPYQPCSAWPCVAASPILSPTTTQEHPLLTALPPCCPALGPRWLPAGHKEHRRALAPCGGLRRQAAGRGRPAGRAAAAEAAGGGRAAARG